MDNGDACTTFDAHGQRERRLSGNTRQASVAHAFGTSQGVWTADSEPDPVARDVLPGISTSISSDSASDLDLSDYGSAMRSYPGIPQGSDDQATSHGDEGHLHGTPSVQPWLHARTEEGYSQEVSPPSRRTRDRRQMNSVDESVELRAGSPGPSSAAAFESPEVETARDFGSPTQAKDGRPQSSRDHRVIKVGSMLLWNPAAMPWPAMGSEELVPQPGWTGVSCILRESGELMICAAADAAILSTVRLPMLRRSAVQRLDASIAGSGFPIAIYTHTGQTPPHVPMPQLLLSLDSREHFEVWFVLLRAFTGPEIYGQTDSAVTDSLQSEELLPGLAPDSVPSLFRIEKTLRLRVAEAKIGTPATRPGSGYRHGDQRRAIQEPSFAVQVLVDSHMKCSTLAKPGPVNPTWYESFELYDLGPLASDLNVRLVNCTARRLTTEALSRQIKIPPRPRSSLESDYGAQRNSSGLANGNLDMLVGELKLDISDAASPRDQDIWWPLQDASGEVAGSLLLRVQVEKEIVLMDEEYHELSELLHTFSNGLTMMIADRIPSELPRLAEHLLNIFQVSGSAEAWLTSLAEEEIDGVRKELNTSQMRYAVRLEPTDPKEPLNHFGRTGDREGIVRDFGKSATAEANLLFRGNTLLSKSFDVHMKRVGKDYLEDTLGAKLRDISEYDIDCEVDPNKLHSSVVSRRHWDRLVSLTKEVWDLIYQSAKKCPLELRIVFKHIRACAEDRYGDFLRTVSYSSVSGFLFLRFFCAAILNPQIFGLVRDQPRPRAHRTLTLIAKSLQGLANMTTFGAKEPWMEPMNKFLTTHKQQFKDFINAVCSTTAGPLAFAKLPAYSTPLAMLTRLPPASREGFPSLPCLIDPSRSFAALVNLWLDTSAKHLTSLDGDLLQFQYLCAGLRQRAHDCWARHERTRRRSGDAPQGWVALAEQMDAATLHLAPDSPSPERPYDHSRPSTSGRPDRALHRPVAADDAPPSDDVDATAAHVAALLHSSSAPSSDAEARTGVGRFSYRRERSESRSRPGSARKLERSRSRTRLFGRRRARGAELG